jgi:hypothetical protein
MNMTRTLVCFTVAVLASVFATTSMATDFYTISSVSASTAATDLWPASNLIQGPAVGFSDAAPYDKTSGDAEGNWVTDACGFPCDYLGAFPAPVLTFDLGSDVLLTELSVWGYSASNSNGAKDISVRFATEAEGTAGFGTSVAYNPTFSFTNDALVRQSKDFSEAVTARYVELSLIDNFFSPPGDGSAGELAGGDRIGLGEVAFAVVPEPGSITMLLLGLLSLLKLRRR